MLVRALIIVASLLLVAQISGAGNLLADACSKGCTDDAAERDCAPGCDDCSCCVRVQPMHQTADAVVVLGLRVALAPPKT